MPNTLQSPLTRGREVLGTFGACWSIFLQHTRLSYSINLANVVGPLAASDHLEFVLTRDFLATRGLSLVSNFLPYIENLSQIFNIFILFVLNLQRECLSVCPSFLVILGQQCVFQRCQDLVLLFTSYVCLTTYFVVYFEYICIKTRFVIGKWKDVHKAEKVQIRVYI